MDAETLAFTPAVTVAELIRTKQLSPSNTCKPCWIASNGWNHV